ncbi:uncharacterized protein LOC120775454 [Bactrocera tryoni]|uniref:uncharacterized protein LOC120775454 n=1 Tax=Bactrocera tryoni TaxID=59916 RepID=UPI001A982E9E|nr:uncharacterized protein LOC120775454 [Bactrocera tryoni]
MANADMDMRANLTDLSKLPVKEFEKHFRDWMERDDVARSLQAKLRTDLISNFNKTALGRQILAQTTTTTTGGSAQRLTLSPLVLALNTLVAEFLYAQNCHFSLSVFCTEVPFRNTLPDFESSPHFRFSGDEIKEILEAIFSKTPQETPFKNSIIRKYEHNKNISLLMVILRYLLRQKEEYAKRIASIKPGTANEGTQTVEDNNTTHEPERRQQPNDSLKASCAKNEIPSTNVRYLNKYLVILSTKVKEMSEQLNDLRYNRGSLPSTRLAKSVRTRRYEKLNHSLERVTSQLKHMTHTKRKNKQVGAVVSAVDALATQFTKCVESFRSVSKELIASNEKQSQLQHILPTKPVLSQAAVQVDLSNGRSNCAEHKKPTAEKSYTDWVHEMRHTRNGQKFLDRIEVSLKKALNKQRELLRKESDQKLRHQKEVLKIQYKEKLMEHVSRLPQYDYSNEARMLNESIGQQLKEFESRHTELLQKIQNVHKTEATDLPTAAAEKEDAANANAQTDMTDEIVRRVVREMEPKINPSDPQCSNNIHEITVSDTRTRDPLLKDVVNTQKQLQKMAQSIAQQERTVDQIVYEAKMRIQELENESNQLELNFRNYLDRQRLQAETMREVVSSLSESNKKDIPKIADSYRKTLKDIRTSSTLRAENERREVTTKSRHKTVESKNSLIDLTDQENKNPNFEYRNAILEAKTKLFKGDRQYAKMGSDEEEFKPLGFEPYYYNRNFGTSESQSNLISGNAHSFQWNENATRSSEPRTDDSNFNSNTNTVSARSNGAPLHRAYAVLPNTPQASIPKMDQLTSKATTSVTAEASKTSAAKPMQTAPAATMPPVTAKTTSVSTVVTAAVAAKRAGRYTNEWTPDGFLQHLEAASQTYSNQSASDHSKKEEEASDTVSSTRSAKKGGSPRGKVEGRDKKIGHGETTDSINPVEATVNLLETMERMHRLFTETPTGVKQDELSHSRADSLEKEKSKPKQKIQQSNQQKQHVMSPKTRKGGKTSSVTNESASTFRKFKQNKTERRERRTKTAKSAETPNSNGSFEEALNTFASSDVDARKMSAERSVPATRPQYYNITSSATAINVLAPTISSTTFSICVDDNLKEVVSESSIEIASMVEAVDEEIELEELVAAVEEEEEVEEEVDEEYEPMGTVKVSSLPMPAIEEVSRVSSSSNSAVHISDCGGGGGGAERRKKSDSGSDFWE